MKTVFDAKTGELLGAHMVGAEVTELIQGYTVGKTAELVETDFMNTVFPHPTLSEMMHESVLAAYGRPLHVWKCAAWACAARARCNHLALPKFGRRCIFAAARYKPLRTAKKRRATAIKLARDRRIRGSREVR